MNRKFNEKEFYDQSQGAYSLLPFKFQRLNSDKEVIVNEVGDYLVVPTRTVEKIVNRKIDKSADGNLYADLLSNFFIAEKDITPIIDVLATRYRTKKSFLENFTGLHIFVLTLRCEHNCHYCQVSRVSEDKEKFDMSIRHIDKAIEVMMKSPNPNITMEIQGGEPLLVFDNVVYAIEKAKTLGIELNKNMTFVICTNLSLINDNVLEYCRLNNILISTSLDGPEYVHNQNRHHTTKNSYETTIKGISKCREYLGYDNVTALMTTSVLSLQYPKEIVEEYYNQGFRNIFLRPISPYGFALKNDKINKYETEKFLEFYKKAIARIINYNKDGELFIEDYSRIILEKVLTSFTMGFVDLLSPAGLINNVVVYNYDGNVYASDESRMLAEMKDYSFRLGNLDSDNYEEIFYGRKALEIAEVWATEYIAGCSECAFQNYCGADPVRAHVQQGDMYGYRPTSSHCQKNMEIIRYLIELMDNDKEVENIFNSWVNS